MSPAARTPDPPIVTRAFLGLTAAHFLQALGYASMLLLPVHLEHLGASRTEIGAIMAVSAVGGLLFRPLVGWALDAVGRKPTLLAGTLLATVGLGMVGLVTRISPLVYVARLVFGVGVGAMFTGYFTFAADLVPPTRRTEGLALFGISGLVPVLVNPAAERLGLAAGALRAFFPAMGLVVLASLLFLRAVPELPRTRSTAAIRPLAALLELGRPRLWPVWLATVVFSGFVALFFAFATVAAADHGMAHPADIWLTYALGAAVVRLGGGRILDRIGPRNLVAPALASYAFAAMALGGAQTGGALLLAGLLGGVGHGFCFPVLASQVVSRVPEPRRGAGLATYTGLWDLSALTLPPLLGMVADARGDRAMFDLAALGAGLLLALWALLEHAFGGERARPANGEPAAGGPA
ncbi:MAG: MFS transporter [Deltaproteobacteria bacterium]|nr:MFS transporter [Deltaproteobacteria bacterium]